MISLEGDIAIYMRLLFFILYDFLMIFFLLNLSCLRFLVPVVVCLVLMLLVWFGLANLHTRLSGLGILEDRTEQEEEIEQR